MLSRQKPSSTPLHRLARFVIEEAVAMMFNLEQDEIYLVERWAHVVYVHGKGVSRFISYADFPPILGVAPPTGKDFVYWRRRWKKRQQAEQKKQTLPFWVQFFAHQFHYASSVLELYNWGKLLGMIKFAFTEANLQRLRELYRQERWTRRQLLTDLAQPLAS